jgi:uncharacterized LabA/DUF88 family protein
MKTDKAAIFVDVQNIYYTVKQNYNCHFDYNTFWKQVTFDREVVKAIAYATDRGDQKQKHFQRILKTIGFDLKLTPFLQRSDGSTKADWDVGISLDMLEYAKLADTIILASGDGDFTPVVKKLIDEHHVSVEVYGVPGLTAKSLIEATTKFIPIEGNLLLSIPATWEQIK